jgi:hypothetical protein
VRIALAVIAPAILGAVTGYLLGVSEGAYIALSLIAALGGIGAGFEHDGAGAGVKRGLLGGTIFGAFLLLANELHNATAQVDLPDPAILLVVITAVLGILLGAFGGWLRARLDSDFPAA